MEKKRDAKHFLSISLVFAQKTLLEDRFAVAVPIVSRGSWSRAPGPRDLAMLHMWAKMWDRPRVCESDDDACVF